MAEFIPNGREIYDTVNGGFILLNFPKGECGHGCKFNCPYCGFKKTKEFHKRIAPTHEDVDDFLKYNRGQYIKLSGGGDPLFNYEANRDYLVDLITYIHDVKHRGIFITTREFETVLKYKNTDFKDVDIWSFSVDTKNPALYECIKQLVSQNKSVLVSIVYTEGQTDREALKEIVKYYSEVVKWRILIVSNYFNEFPKDWDKFGNELSEISHGLAKVKPENEVTDVLTLVGDKIYYQIDVDEMIR